VDPTSLRAGFVVPFSFHATNAKPQIVAIGSPRQNASHTDSFSFKTYGNISVMQFLPILLVMSVEAPASCEMRLVKRTPTERTSRRGQALELVHPKRNRIRRTPAICSQAVRLRAILATE
jgi:hypothetical protein